LAKVIFFSSFIVTLFFLLGSLEKRVTRGPVTLEEIRPIVVRSHESKIMEKAILAKINGSCPHLIESKMYQTGFKEDKSTGIHISRLL